MPGPRISLRRLLAAVAASAIGCAFIAAAANLQVRALSGMTLAILAVSTAAAVACRGRSRAFAIGFAVVGWAYYAASTTRPDGLPTARLIEAAYERFIGLPTTLSPDEVADLVNELLSFLVAGHLVLTMLLATLGGLVALAVSCLVRRAGPVRASASTATP